MGSNNQEQPTALDEGTHPSPTIPGYWEDQISERLKLARSPAERAIILAEELESAAAVYRQAPFAVTVARKADEASLDAVRKVAQLARVVAKELRVLAAVPSADGGTPT